MNNRPLALICAVLAVAAFACAGWFYSSAQKPAYDLEFIPGVRTVALDPKITQDGTITAINFLAPDRDPHESWAGVQTGIFQNGRQRTLAVDGEWGTQVECGSINRKGEIVGMRALDRNGNSTAVRCKDGSLEDLAPLTQARDINDRGHIAGIVGHAMEDSHAVVLSGGKVTDLGTLGGPWSFARAINAQGDVVGNSANNAGATRAFLWHNGKMMDLGTLGGRSSYAGAINDAGDVVGSSEVPGSEGHPFLFKNGKMTDLGMLPGVDWCGAAGINNHGEIVGSCQLHGGNSHAVLLRKGRVYDLNDLTTVPDNVEKNKRYLEEAWSINDRGEIVGQAFSINNKRVGLPITDNSIYRLTPRGGPGLVGAIAAAAAGLVLAILALVLFRRSAAAGAHAR